MGLPIHILHLEDDLNYAELVTAFLDNEGISSSSMVVSELPEFAAALEKETFDIILADYSLPNCTGLDALKVAQEKSPNTPFLMVSGTIGEQAAIESLRHGASDYVLKHWPERLVPAVRRAAEEARERAQRMQAERRLTHHERYFRALTENSLDVLTILSADGLFEYNSPSLKNVLGYEPEELLGRNAFELIHPEDVPGAMAAFQQALANPELRVTHAFRHRRKDASWCYLEAVGQSRLAEPEIRGLVLNSRDITQRKQAEARLRLQGAALDSAANAIIITDRSGKVQWANAAFTRLTGYSVEEVVGQNPRLLKSGQHTPDFYQKLWETICAGRVWQSEMINRRKDGTLYTEEATITPVRDERGEISHFVAVKQDITERRQLESQLRQAQKMEAVGQLAGGVAHDFNNLLLVIGGNAELVLMDADQLTDEARGCLSQITAATKRAGNLTRQLLAFSRKQTIQLQKINLNNVVTELAKMLKRIIGENILLEWTPGQPFLLVQADVGMLEQVIVNLVVNARDAMPSGGRLAIATNRTAIDEQYARSHPEAHPGAHICLSVTDTGTGISAENLPHIFEPFFTTKAPGQGTGLGLAMVYGIVKQHRGWVEVASQTGAGTTFNIFLPALPNADADSASAQAATTPRGGKERILLVEDDMATRVLTRRILEKFGYSVWEAASGREALQVWDEHAAEVDLVLTDMLMPDGVSGYELAKRLHTQRPLLKAILTSGYNLDAAGKDTEFFGRIKGHFLQKPYPPALLLQTVRRCLDEQSTREQKG